MSDSDNPKAPEHFDLFESDHPRAMTPYEGFGSSSKMAAAKPEPIDHLAAVARLFPRDPKTPPTVNEYERQRAERDTDRIEHFDTADQTPAQRPFEIRVEQRLDDVEKRLGQLEESDKKKIADLAIIKKSSQDMAQLTLETHELVKAIAKSQRDLEFERKWVPAAAWLVTTVIAVVALLRTFH